MSLTDAHINTCSEHWMDWCLDINEVSRLPKVLSAIYREDTTNRELAKLVAEFDAWLREEFPREAAEAEMRG